VVSVVAPAFLLRRRVETGDTTLEELSQSTFAFAFALKKTTLKLQPDPRRLQR